MGSGADISGFKPLFSFQAGAGPTGTQGKNVQVGRMNIRISDGTVIQGVKVARYDPTSFKDKLFYTFHSATWKPVTVGGKLMFVNYKSFSNRIQQAVGFQQTFLDRVKTARDSSKVFKQSMEAMVQINKATIDPAYAKQVQKFALGAIFRGEDSVAMPKTLHGPGTNIVITTETIGKKERTSLYLVAQNPSISQGASQGASKAYHASSLLRNATVEWKKVSDSVYDSGYPSQDAFQKEVSCLKKLAQLKSGSPHVLKCCHSVSTIGGSNIAGMSGAMLERCNGGDFKAVEAQRESISQAQKLKIAQQLISGLKDIHEGGLVFSKLNATKVLFAEKNDGVRFHGFHEAEKATEQNMKDNVYSCAVLMLRLGISKRIGDQWDGVLRAESDAVLNLQDPWGSVANAEWILTLEKGNTMERLLAQMLNPDPTKRPSAAKCAEAFAKMAIES